MWLMPANVEFPLKLTDAHIMWLYCTRVRTLESSRHRAQTVLPFWLRPTRAPERHAAQALDKHALR